MAAKKTTSTRKRKTSTTKSTSAKRKTTKKRTTRKKTATKNSTKPKEPSIRTTKKWQFNYDKNIDSKSSFPSEEKYRQLIDRITKGDPVDNNNLLKSFKEFVK